MPAHRFRSRRVNRRPGARAARCDGAPSRGRTASGDSPRPDPVPEKLEEAPSGNYDDATLRRQWSRPRADFSPGTGAAALVKPREGLLPAGRHQGAIGWTRFRRYDEQRPYDDPET